MRIIEFYGLPGSGKSTVSTLLIQSLIEKGFSIKTHENYSREYNGKLLILKGLFTFSGLRFLISMLCRSLGNKFLSDKERFKRAIYCLSLFGYYRSVVDCDFIILDEGIIQGFVSALYDWPDAYDISWLCPILENSKICSVYIGTDPELSNKNLVKRSTPNHGRCDRIKDDSQRIDVLKVQHKRFLQIYEASLHKIMVAQDAENPVDIICRGLNL